VPVRLSAPPRLIMTASEGDLGRSEELGRIGLVLAAEEPSKSSRGWPTGVEPKDGVEVEPARESDLPRLTASPILLGGILPSSEISVMRAVRGWYSLTVESDDIRECEWEVVEEEV